MKNYKLWSGVLAIALCLTSCKEKSEQNTTDKQITVRPLVISTWNHGIPANEAAWKVLSKGGSSLDAVEQGVMVPEADSTVTSVGLGGYPDRDGNVTLDACIMDENNNCGSVAFLEDIVHPISVARLVMEKTPHLMLVGKGAREFAISQGFKPQNLLTEKAKKAHEEWLKTSQYKPIVNIENHDTIGMLAIDENGNISGACTTSGMAWKMNGRVGDSPLIGAGLFLDNEVGGAVATGVGEAVIRTAGSAMVVEMMRQGKSPQEACEIIIKRIYDLYKNSDIINDLQVGFLAVNKNGETGAFSIHPGFNYALETAKQDNILIDAQSLLKKSDN